MARLDKKTKAELIVMLNERGSEIEHLRKEVEKINKELIESRKKYHALEADFKGSEESFAQQIKNINLKASEEIQALRNKVSERDRTIAMQGGSYKDLRDSYDELVYKNGINRSNACKYKVTTIILTILFIIAFVGLCI